MDPSRSASRVDLGPGSVRALVDRVPGSIWVPGPQCPWPARTQSIPVPDWDQTILLPSSPRFRLESLIFKAPSPGELVFVVNDKEPQNNTGHFIVSLTHYVM